MTLICQVGNTPFDIQHGSFRLTSRLDEHDQCSFVVVDFAGTFFPAKGMRVYVYDTVMGPLFTGVIHTATRLNVLPRPQVLWQIDCQDIGVWAASKRTISKRYDGMPAGAIVGDLYNAVLAAESISAKIASRYEQSAADWQAGTLSNLVVSADQQLALAKAGSDLSEPLPGFMPPFEYAIKFVGTASQGQNNAFVYWKIWDGSLTVQAGDVLQYEIWISSSSPEIKCGVDLLFSDGSGFRDNDNGNTDYQNLPPHPATDLSGLANDQWYFRSFGLSGTLIGKTIKAVTIGFEGDAQGTYTAYIRRIKYWNVGPPLTLRATFFNNQAALNASLQISNAGYHDVSVQVVTAFDKPATRTDTVSLSPVAILRAASCLWQVGRLIGNVASATTPPPTGGLSAIDMRWPFGGIGIVAQANGGLQFDQFTATNASATTYGADTFARANTANGTWGTATDGQAWAHLAGSATTFAVTANKGVVTNTPTAWDRFALGSNFSIAGDMEIAVRCRVDTTGSGFGVFLRCDASGQKGYLAMYDGLNAVPGLTIYRLDRGLAQLANMPYSVTAAQSYWIKARILGQSIAAKIWKDGDPEPAYDQSAPGSGSTEAASVSSSGVVDSTTDETLSVQTSIDGGASWQSIATSGDAVPRLLPGMNVASRNLLVRRTISGGKYADTSAHFVRSAVLASTGYNATKSDVVRSFVATSDWNAGTYNNLQSPAGGGLSLIGYTYNFDQAPIANVTEFGQGSPGPDAFIRVKQCVLRASPGFDTKMRFDQAGTYANGVIEVDLKIHNETGLVYRTTGWSNLNDSYAYTVDLDPGVLRLNRGGNGSSSVVSQTIGFNSAANNWRHLKVVFSGSSHAVYVDDALVTTFSDGTYTAAGGVALRHYNGGTTNPDYAYFDNFGVCVALSGSWTSPAISLAPAGSYGGSVISWDDSAIPAGVTSALVEASLDGGVSFQSVANGTPIPGLLSGQSLAGLSLLLRVTLSAKSASVQPVMKGLSVWVSGSYSASGSRVSPALSCAPVAGPAGAALVSWRGTQPAGTSIIVDSSLDGSTFTQVGSGESGSAAIAGIATQPEPTLDSFDADSSSTYTSTARTGGTAATWTWDTANSRVSGSGGVSALLLCNALSAQDLDLFAVLDQSEAAGLVWRFQDSSNYYGLSMADASSVGSTPNTMHLYKVVGNARSLISSVATISFVRGTAHQVRVQVRGTQFVVWFDGAQVLAATDSDLAIAGQCGLQAESTPARYYQFRVQPVPASVASQSVYSRLRLSSTDPTATPLISAAALTVSAPTIEAGSTFSQTSTEQASVQKILDVLKNAGTSGNGTHWTVTAARELLFQSRRMEAAPYLLKVPDDPQIFNLSIENSADFYCNRVILQGVLSSVPFTDVQAGDGSRRQFTLPYPLAAVPQIMLNGQAQSVGIKGLDTNKDWYWSAGDAVLVQDEGGTLLSALDTLQVDGLGQTTTTVMREDPPAQAALAAVEGGTGIVESVIDVSSLNLDVAAATTYGDSALARAAIIGRTVKFETFHPGLQPGQLLTAFIPAAGMVDVPLLVSSVDVAVRSISQSGSAPPYVIRALGSTLLFSTLPASRRPSTRYIYTVEATELKVFGSWQKILSSVKQ